MKDFIHFFAPVFTMAASSIVQNFWLLVPGNVFIFALVEVVKVYFRARRRSDKHGIPNLVIIASVFILGIVYAWGLGRYQGMRCSEAMIYQGIFLSSVNVVIFLGIRGGVSLWKWRFGGKEGGRRK